MPFTTSSVTYSISGLSTNDHPPSPYPPPPPPPPPHLPSYPPHQVIMINCENSLTTKNNSQYRKDFLRKFRFDNSSWLFSCTNHKHKECSKKKITLQFTEQLQIEVGIHPVCVRVFFPFLFYSGYSSYYFKYSID